MNPLYQMLNQQPQPVQQAQMPANNPMQFLQAMQNPAAFVRQRFPDIPDSIANNPVQILNYLQQTRGITNQQIQQLYRMYGGGR